MVSISRITVVFNILICLLVMSGKSYAQLLDSATLASKPIYTSLDEALKNPTQVYRLSLKKQKLKVIPPDVFKLVNLHELDVSRNKITSIPSVIGNLTYLITLDASGNYLTMLPQEIGLCLNIKRLILNRNYITELPWSIGDLENLEYLDLWSNSIIEFPESIGKLKDSLKEVDLRVINMNDERQEAIRALLPDSKLIFSRSCNCN